MSKLAILGGPAVRTGPFPTYPRSGREESVVKTGQLSAQESRDVEAFERDFSEYCGANFGIATRECATAVIEAIYESSRTGEGAVAPREHSKPRR